ncbi:hypothetical protein BH11PLA2_BH11PLA2_27130 [soil metagenome]
MNKLVTLFALGLLALTGCGPTVTDVIGTVQYQGKPVVFGTVMVIDAGGEPKYGQLKTDGSFTITGVRPGPVKVSVSSPTPPGVTGGRVVVKSPDALDGLDGRKPADRAANVDPVVAKGWFPLPEKFGDPTTSGVTAVIATGQPLPIDLK